MSDAAGRRRFIVGLDASEEADAALAWARSHAGDDDEIVAVHAWQLPMVTSYDALIVQMPDDAEAVATAGLTERVRGENDDRIVPIVRQGHAGRAVVEEADDRDADMIVVGHRGQSRLSMLLGSTANYVVHHAHRPVVIVRAGLGERTRRVVVGVEDMGSDAQGDLVAWAAALPGVEHVTVVHAWVLPPIAETYVPMANTLHEDMDAAALDVARAAVDAAGPLPDGVEVVAESARGPAGSALIREAEEADLVVVGTRGRGGFAGLVLGSTSASVAAHAPAVVAVVP